MADQRQNQPPPKPVHYIELGGKSRPVRYGYRAQRDICAHYDVKLADMQRLFEKFGLDDLPILLHHGLADGARKEGKPYDETPETVDRWLEDYDGQILGDEKGLFTTVLMAFMDASHLDVSGKVNGAATTMETVSPASPSPGTDSSTPPPPSA